MSGEEEAQEQQQQTRQEEETPAPEDAPLSGATTATTPSTSTPVTEKEEEEEEVFTYRALVLTGHGGYDKVKLQVRKGRPVVQSGQVLVRMKACGLNFADLMGRQGLDELLPPPPVVMGMEGAGVVEEVHPDVTHRKVGDRVIVLNHDGLWQEVVAVAAENTFLMPEPMSFEEGAALPVNYLTAYLMLFEMANLRPGRTVLIHMAAGGVGIAATQLCQSVGDVTVFGTASASKHETIVQGGVAHPIDYRTKDYVEEIRKISPKGLDIVLDPLGGSDTQKGYGLLKPMGTLIVFGAANCVTGQKKSLLAMAKTWYNQLSLSTLKLMQANKAVCGFHLGYLKDVPLITSTMDTLLGLYGQGKIRPCVDSSYHFEDVADAMRRMQERHNIGKVLLLPEPKKEVEEEEEVEEEVAAPASNPEPEETVAGEGVDEKREVVDTEGVAKDN